MDVILVYVALISAVVCDHPPATDTLTPRQLRCIEELRSCVILIETNQTSKAHKCFESTIGKNYLKFHQ